MGIFRLFKKKKGVDAQTESENPKDNETSAPSDPKLVPESASESESASTHQEMQSIIPEIPGLADSFIETAEETMKIKFDFSEEHVLEIDRFVEETWGGSPPVMIDPMVALLGAYVGESIRKNLGGQWVDDEEIGPCLDNISDCGIKTNPFAKVRKRFQNGEEDSIGYYYLALKSMAENGGELPTNFPTETKDPNIYILVDDRSYEGEITWEEGAYQKYQSENQTRVNDQGIIALPPFVSRMSKKYDPEKLKEDPDDFVYFPKILIVEYPENLDFEQKLKLASNILVAVLEVGCNCRIAVVNT